MEKIRALHSWTEMHREVAYDLLRIYIGVALFVRGILFLADTASTVEPLLASAPPSFASAVVIHYVGLAHLAGGLLLALGLLTRVAALVQVPILGAAVFQVHLQEGLMGPGQSLELSALVLVLLVLFTGFGAGRWSLDDYVFRRAEAAPAPQDAVPASSAVHVTPRHEMKAREERRRARKSATLTQENEASCSCGHDLNHPMAQPEVRYSTLGKFYFLAGITAPIKEVLFRCAKCGQIITRTRDRAIRKAFRYRRDA